MKLLAFALCVIVLVGCGGQEPSSTVDAPSTEQTTASPANSAVETSSTPAKSAEELAAAYKSAFERGDTAAIERMVYWEGIPADHRDWTLRAIFNVRYADGVNGKIPSIEVTEPLESWLNSDAYPLKPVKMLSGSYTGDGGGGDLRIPIGELNGEFYFCARKPAG